ncbi:MAG: dehydrogenase [Eubacteriales bacterium]|nr:dehydrogenase [Eubacteriales bacterium]
MKYRINQLKLNIKKEVKKEDLLLPKEIINNFKIVKRSIDARDKNNIQFSYNIDIDVDEKKFNKLPIRLKKKFIISNSKNYIPPKLNKNIKIENDNRPIVVGFGPAGIFTSLILSNAGCKPIIYEKGEEIENRTDILFGEGGAGTFSDGKLNTLNYDPSGINEFVLNTLIENGANSNILYDKLAHIGTDKLKPIIHNIKEKIISLGSEIHFNTEFSLNNFNYKQYKAPIILCTGHSSINIYNELFSENFILQRKPFAMGIRVEHKQELINKAQYGNISKEDLNILGNASYKLSYKCRDGRSIYSFCMCPGGYVINTISNNNQICTNGMSYHSRSSDYANSAIVCNIKENDIKGVSPLDFLNLQIEIEKKAYKLGNGSIPKTTYKEYKEEKHNIVRQIYENINLPFDLNQDIIEGIEYFKTKIYGFNNDDTVIYGPETRTSSVIKILRDEEYKAINKDNIYVAGEGAGYAGGIMSSAIDGVKVAQSIIQKINGV